MSVRETAAGSDEYKETNKLTKGRYTLAMRMAFLCTGQPRTARDKKAFSAMLFGGTGVRCARPCAWVWFSLPCAFRTASVSRP